MKLFISFVTLSFIFTQFCFFQGCSTPSGKTKSKATKKQGPLKTEKETQKETEEGLVFEYAEEFKQKIKQVQNAIHSGKIEEAYTLLQQVSEISLKTTDEKALYHYLLGLLGRYKHQYKLAISHLKEALKQDENKKGLLHKILLQLSYAHLELKEFKEAEELHHQIKTSKLSNSDQQTYLKIQQQLWETNPPKDNLSWQENLYNSLKQETFSTEQLEINPNFKKLQELFLSSTSNDQLKFLKAHIDDHSLVWGELSYKLCLSYLQENQSGLCQKLLLWAQESYKGPSFITEKLHLLLGQLENIQKINPFKIGVILPLSGNHDKVKFAKRILNGIHFALKELFPTSFSLELRDTQGLSSFASLQVRDLIEKDQVSFIIGGLYPEDALLEYSEAKKLGCFYLSLSDIFLPSHLKGPFLIELSGSYESVSREILENLLPLALAPLPKRPAIAYPLVEKGNKQEFGKIVAEYFFQLAEKKNISMGGVLSYPANTSSPPEFYTDLAENLLGVNYSNRKEEIALWSSIKSAMASRKYTPRQIREFLLWARPNFSVLYALGPNPDLIQLISQIEYLFPYGLMYVGGPQWRNRSLLQNLPQNANIYFVSDDIESIEEDSFIKNFVSSFNSKPGLLELRAIDGLQFYAQSLKTTPTLTEEKNRDKFNSLLLQQNKFTGKTGSWAFSSENNQWFKSMAIFRYRNGKMQKESKQL